VTPEIIVVKTLCCDLAGFSEEHRHRLTFWTVPRPIVARSRPPIIGNQLWYVGTKLQVAHARVNLRLRNAKQMTDASCVQASRELLLTKSTLPCSLRPRADSVYDRHECKFLRSINDQERSGLTIRA
jgi:hypothetical protein